MKYLFRFEIKGIQSFIFASNKLKEIAGGSAIVDSIFSPSNFDEWGVSASQVLQCAAGAATILFESKAELESFVQTFPLQVQQKAPGIELTYAWVPFDAGSERSVVKSLMDALKFNRNKKTVQLPELGPLVLRSGRTGGGVIGSEKRFGQYDLASKIKMDAGKDNRDSLERKVMPDKWASTYGFTKGECFERTGGMVAIIHIDGNDIGKRIIERDLTLKEYQDFSTTMSDITLQSTQVAMDAVITEIDLETKDERHPRQLGVLRTHASRLLELPIRPIIVGGDDCTIVIEDQYALLFAETYIKEFRRLSQSNDNKRKLLGQMEASAGIAFVKAKAPFASNYELSEALCSHSKNALRERCANSTGQYTPSAVTFHRVTTSAIPNWRQILRDEYSSDVRNPGNPEKGSRLMAGPYLVGNHTGVDGFYTIEELEHMVSKFGHKSIPRGPFREWLRTVQTDPVRAQDRWDRIDTVLSEKKRSKKVWAILKEAFKGSGYPTFVQRLEGSPSEIDSNPDAQRFVTPVGDALMLKGLGVQMKPTGENQ